MDSDTTLQSLFAVVLVAALSPLVAALLPGPRIAPIVFMIIGGALIGPEVLDLAQTGDVALFSDLGLGFLFLAAGYEIDLRIFRRRTGSLAVRGWFLSLVLALPIVGILWATGIVSAWIAIVIGLTTTALGTLLPIMKDNGALEARFGPYIFATGAVGEILPIIAMAILLSSYGAIWGLTSLVLLALATFVIMRGIDAGGRWRVWQRLKLEEEGTAQTTLRWTLVLLVGLLFLSEDLGVDIVMGAFLAGIVLRRWSPGNVHSLERKLETVGYGVFIPMFFVSSGMGLDVQTLLSDPLRMLGFFALLFAVRGLPSLWLYRHDLSRPERWQMVLYTATTLPLLVALTSIGLENGLMDPADAASLVGAGVLSVLVFPPLAEWVSQRAPASAGGGEPSSPAAAGSDPVPGQSPASGGEG